MDAFANYEERGDLKLQMQWLQIYRPILEASPEVKAAAICGSFAKGHPDRLSDLDLVIYTDQKDMDLIFKQLAQSHPFEVIQKWEGHPNQDYAFGKYVYGNFTSAEIHIFSLENKFRLHKPFIILKDTDGLMAERTKEGPPPEHKDFDLLGEDGIDALPWALFDMFKWIQRGNTELTLLHLQKLAKQLAEK